MKKVTFSGLFALVRGVVYFCLTAAGLIWFVHFEQGIVQAAYILCALVVSTLCAYVIVNRRRHKFCFAALLAVTLLMLLGVYGFWRSYSRIGGYPVAPVESEFFLDKHVLVLVPHQDDDINLVGGIAEQYTHRGSRVSVAYTTNGDYFDKSELRFREALEVAEMMGIAREDVHFLGFGDSWQPNPEAHIYNSLEEDHLWTSYIGYQETYGTGEKDCYKPYAYTRQNYVDSIRSLILELRPDVIYVVDYDSHIEHRAATLFFDEAMCSILRSVPDYRPKVYKGFCYRTAWLAAPDFLQRRNILSTVHPEGMEDSELELRQYPWEDRVRVPVLPEGLNRFLSQTDGFQQLSTYWSQGAMDQAPNVINGDKVFWEKRTDSLLYNAEILLGDQQTRLLNDFKLMDSADISSVSIADGVVPVEEPIRVTLTRPENLVVLGLYDDPSGENQILEGYVLLENGEQVAFGPLNDNGTATYVPLPGGRQTASFEICITGSRGQPGLTEIGGFAAEVPPEDQRLQYFMFADEEDNFVYDYIMDTDTERFTLYTYPGNCAVTDADFQITMTGSKNCGYTLENGVLTVTCPKLAKCQLEIRCGDAVTYLSFSHPGALQTRLLDRVSQLDYQNIYGITPFSLEHQEEYYRELIAKLQIRFASIFG